MTASALLGLAVALPLALIGWLASLWRRDASLADRIWPWLIALPALSYAGAPSSWSGEPGAWWRQALALLLLLAWALRLSVYISLRNWGHGEDRRYAAMRANHGTAFAWKSLYLVFGLQALLAWVISAPLLALSGQSTPWKLLDSVGLLLATFGLIFEAVADAQMSRFRAQPHADGAIMERGLWRLSRHPNYFGESCVWWGLGLMALAGGGWQAAWSLVSPLLITFLLLRVSGVSLLEKDLSERRPAYRDYMLRTRAFFPWLPRRTGSAANQRH